MGKDISYVFFSEICLEFLKDPALGELCCPC